MKPQRSFDLEMGSFWLRVRSTVATSRACAWSLTVQRFKTQALPLLSCLTLIKSLNFSKPLLSQQ